jgi:hypothetical protein
MKRTEAEIQNADIELEGEPSRGLRRVEAR